MQFWEAWWNLLLSGPGCESSLCPLYPRCRCYLPIIIEKTISIYRVWYSLRFQASSGVLGKYPPRIRRGSTVFATGWRMREFTSCFSRQVELHVLCWPRSPYPESMFTATPWVSKDSFLSCMFIISAFTENL